MTLKKELNYKQNVTIDEGALDYELLIQADLRRKYGENLSEMESRRDRMQDQLDVVKAEIDRDIRNAPESFDISVKLTETVVTNTILLQEDFREKLELVRDLEYEVKYAKHAVQSIDHKKSALEELVKLHGQSYFAGPSIPRNLSEERKKKNVSAESTSKKAMKRGK